MLAKRFDRVAETERLPLANFVVGFAGNQRRERRIRILGVFFLRQHDPRFDLYPAPIRLDVHFGHELLGQRRGGAFVVIMHELFIRRTTGWVRFDFDVLGCHRALVVFRRDLVVLLGESDVGIALQEERLLGRKAVAVNLGWHGLRRLAHRRENHDETQHNCWGDKPNPHTPASLQIKPN